MTEMVDHVDKHELAPFLEQQLHEHNKQSSEWARLMSFPHALMP